MASAPLTVPPRALRIVCPACRGTLSGTAKAPVCDTCGSRYLIREGFVDLVVGERYDDDTLDCALENEETTNRETVERYWIPLFRRLWPEGAKGRRILSVGCGVGADVEQLVDAGFDAYGIDNGKRVAHWLRRKCAERLFCGNGRHMPFEDSSFDLIFCGCVFPHVGVVGTSFRTTPDYFQQRLELAAEMARVLRPGGRIVSCNPNRFFPFDIFHGHQAGKMTLRPTPPWQHLLLSRGDYLEMFRRFGCVRAVALPVSGYWSFSNSRKTWKGRLLAAPVDFLFRLVSNLSILRGSPLNPWLIVMLEKGAAVPASD
jgi:SAM-dependent methyltransferase